MNNSPIEIFKQWYEEELKLTTVRIHSACCLSTIGVDNFPNARFVSLKDILNNNFVITGTLTSRKGIEIENSEKVALTFWWTETERQVRVQGNAIKISKILADKYFSERNRDSQIVSIVSDQGKNNENNQKLLDEYENIELTFKNKKLKRPKNWGGFEIEPLRIEFLEFKQTRFHNRKLFQFLNGHWEMNLLQP
jgi:pyridoxamine 5'-phosphate oxidase